MCNFFSWVESEGKLFYLTDKDVCSRAGKYILAGCKDNDVLGHGAIRKFYNLTGGQDHERQDFWANDLPEELKLKVKNFDKYWGKMWSSGAFQNDDLRCIICNAPEVWKSKAWEQLLKQKPSDYDLRRIICNAPEVWKSKASGRLLKQKPSNYDLCCIICNAPEVWKSKARAVLEEHNVRR